MRNWSWSGFAAAPPASKLGALMSVTLKMIRSVGVLPSVLPMPSFAGAEDLGDGHSRQDCALLALQAEFGVDHELIRAGHLRERGARLELVDDLGGLGVETLADLVVAPARLDALLDLVERAFPRRRDAGDLVPDESPAGDGQRIVLGADVGREGIVEDLDAFRQPLDRLVDRRPAGPIDRADGHERKLQLGRDLLQLGARGILVFDLVPDLVDLALGAIDRDLMLDLVLDLFERLGRTGLDLDGAHDGGGEAAAHRAADRPRGKAECGLGDHGVDHLRLGDGAEIDVLVGQFAFRGQGIEGEPLGEPLSGSVCLFGIGEGYLLDLPALGNGVAALAQLVGAFGVLVADFDSLGELLGRNRDNHQLAIFRRPEHRLMRIEIGGELLGRGHRDVAQLVAVEHDVIDAALLVLVAVDRLGRGLGRGEFADERGCELVAQRLPALLVDEALLGEAGLADQLLEPARVELPVDAVKRRVVGDALGHVGVGNAEAELAGALVEGGLRDHLAEDLLLDAEGTGLVGRDRTAELLADALQAFVVLLAELVDRDLGAADLGHGKDAEAAENVADAPDAEADDEEQHHGRHDDAAEPVGRGLS